MYMINQNDIDLLYYALNLHALFNFSILVYRIEPFSDYVRCCYFIVYHQCLNLPYGAIIMSM